MCAQTLTRVALLLPAEEFNHLAQPSRRGSRLEGHTLKTVALAALVGAPRVAAVGLARDGDVDVVVELEPPQVKVLAEMR